jgi:hypothetical protein
MPRAPEHFCRSRWGVPQPGSIRAPPPQCSSHPHPGSMLHAAPLPMLRRPTRPRGSRLSPAGPCPPPALTCRQSRPCQTRRGRRHGRQTHPCRLPARRACRPGLGRRLQRRHDSMASRRAGHVGRSRRQRRCWEVLHSAGLAPPPPQACAPGTPPQRPGRVTQWRCGHRGVASSAPCGRAAAHLGRGRPWGVARSAPWAGASWGRCSTCRPLCSWWRPRPPTF